MNIYGVILSGYHVDISTSEKAAKRFATINGYNIVSIRYNMGYIAKEVAYKVNGKWINAPEGQLRYKS